jgi:hypothetical protein
MTEFKDLIQSVFHAGDGLSNAAYNLSQCDTLPEHHRESLKKGQEAWDNAMTFFMGHARHYGTDGKTYEPLSGLDHWNFVIQMHTLKMRIEILERRAAKGISCDR